MTTKAKWITVGVVAGGLALVGGLYSALDYLSAGMFKVREYASHAEALKGQNPEIPSVVPLAAARIWQAFSYDFPGQWVRFALAREHRSDLTASLRPLTRLQAAERIPFVPRRFRGDWPRTLTLQEGSPPPDEARYAFFSTRDGLVTVAIDTESDLVYVWNGVD